MLTPDTIRCISCGAYQENAFLVCPEGRDDAFLVDPGDGLAALQQALRAAGRKLSAILLTHGHFDHMLAAQPLSESTGATVYIHAGDADMLEDPEKSAYNPAVSLLPPPEGLTPEYYGDTLTVCGCTLKVLSTPGHSRGSVCLYEPESGTLFAGDTLFCAGYGRTDLHGGNHREMYQSLMTLFGLPGETIVHCGHGPDTTIATERRRYGR